MRTTKTLSVSLPPSQIKEMERTAKRENRTMSELIRELYERYTDEARREFGGALEDLRAAADVRVEDSSFQQRSRRSAFRRRFSISSLPASSRRVCPTQSWPSISMYSRGPFSDHTHLAHATYWR